VERLYGSRLPHWRLADDGAAYFVTWRLAPGKAELAPTERDLVAGALTYWDPRACTLLAWVVMNDHVHVVVAPVTGVRLETLLHSWKSYTATRMVREHRRAGPVWQRGYYDRVVRNEDELQRFTDYVTRNPWKRWPDLEAYRWVWPQPD
jgi:REP element-mobilizing transposase RayT